MSNNRRYSATRPYKLELETPSSNTEYSEKISFGPRRPGDQGRDILVVRKALGSVELLAPEEANPDVFDNKNHWLDCMTGKEVSLREAATFDSTMEAYLTKFQLDNQFYILSYLFSKYGIPSKVYNKVFSSNKDVEDDGYLTDDERERRAESQILQLAQDQLEAIDTFFQSEFGTLGEATLAVLHGWRPRTRVGATTYYHDPNVFQNETLAHDIIPRTLHQSLVEGTLSQDLATSQGINNKQGLAGIPNHPNYSYDQGAGPAGFKDYLGPDGSNFIASLEKYNATARPSESLSVLNPLQPVDLDTDGNNINDQYRDLAHRHFAALRYELIERSRKSVLYSAFLEVSNNFPKSESVSTMSSGDYADAVSRIGEPDPLTDPDPFVISNTVMGYFYKTDFTLSNLPPFRPAPTATLDEKVEYQQAIRELEQKALYSLLVHLNKPILFKLDPKSASFQDAFTVVGSEYDTIQGQDGASRLNSPTGSPAKERISQIFPKLNVSSGEWLLAPDVFLDNFLEQFESPGYQDLSEDLVQTIQSIQPYTDIEVYESADPDSRGLMLSINTAEPLIKFVEFRFPSLRPGDKYRAKFLINRAKLAQITEDNGILESQLRISESQNSQGALAPVIQEPSNPTDSCDDAPLTEDQQERRYEEYRALAAKRRREIARALRESQTAAAELQNRAETANTSVDLGVFGNANVNLGPINLGDFSGSQDEFSNSVLKAGTSLLKTPLDAFSEWAYNKKFGNRRYVEIYMTYREIKDRVDIAAKDIREAFASCKEDKIRFSSNYDGNLEATKLEDGLLQLKNYIKKKLPQSSDFEFGDDTLAGLVSEIPIASQLGGFDAIQGGASADGAASNWRWKYPNNIKIIFSANTGQIESIQAGKNMIFESRNGRKPKGSYSDLKAQAPALARPMTSIYLSQLYRMSGGLAMGSWLNFFDLSNSELCSDLDLGKKGLAYLKRYTPGLDGIAKTYDALQIWTDQNIKAPFKEWYDERTTSKDFTNLDSVFGQDEHLKMLGNACTVPKVFSEFIHRVSPGALLCDFLKCLKIPAFNLSIPDFSYPDWPDFSIFRWWAGAWKFLWDKLGKIIGRFLCTLARTIIDFLRIPWCEEILRDQLYGEASSSTSVVQNAMARGLVDLGLDQKNADLAPDFIERSGVVLTNRELCRLLQGDPLDPATIAMLTSIARSMGLDQLDDEESIMQLYDHIGTFMPDGFCEALSGTDWLTTATTCEDTATAISDLRRSLLANDASEEDINRVLDEAKDQLMSQARAFELLSEQGLNAIIPPLLDMSNPDAIVNQLPKNLNDQAIKSIKDMFEPTKMSYVSSLSAYGPAYYLDGFKLPTPEDEDFDDAANITVETILENFRLLQVIRDEASGGANSIDSLQKQIHILHQIYETKKYETSDKRILKLFKYQNAANAAHPIHNVPASAKPQHQLWPAEEALAPYREATYDERSRAGNSKETRLYPRPIGFSRNSFFEKDESNNITNKYITSGEQAEDTLAQIDFTAHADQANLGLFNFGSNYLVYESGVPYHFVNNYKLLANAESAEELEPGSQVSYLQQVLQDRLMELQGILSTYLPNVSTPIPHESHLEIIKDVLSASKETSAELRDIAARGLNPLTHPTQGIYFDAPAVDQNNRFIDGPDVRKLTIDFKSALGVPGPSISLYEFKSKTSALPEDSLDQKKYDPYTITLYGDNLFRDTSAENPKVFRFCDSIVGPDNEIQDANLITVGSGDSQVTYIEASHDRGSTVATHVFSNYHNIPPGVYTRREIFARMHLKSLTSMAQRYEVPDAERADEIQEEFDKLTIDGEIRDNLYHKQYPEFLEGIFEQVFYSLRNSRVYDEDGYFDSFRRRVAGQVFYNEIEDCYKNRYSVSQLGTLSFEKLITDEIGRQLRAEMSRPENSFENVDYDDLGPIEKAIQNVCMIGFVRICLVELLLKGSLAYSVWDFEGVYDEPLMKEFIYEFIKHEIERIPSIRDEWKPIISRITGIQAPYIALKRLVQQQSMKMQDLSKNVYNNNPNLDYYKWFTSYFIPQSEVSRTMISIDGDPVDIEAGVFINDVGEVIVEPPEDLRNFERPAYFWWQHPLRDTNNVIINPEIENSNSGLGSVRTALNHVNGNDPFFHIEHGLRVTGPLAALETLILPTREIIEAFTTANIDDNPELFTDVENRIPQKLNIKDSLGRLQNVSHPNIENYDFKETPAIPGSAQGSSVEEYDADSTIDKREEIFHIDDFLGAINGALNEDDLDKYIKHMQGLYDYDEDPDSATGGRQRNTDVQTVDGYPYAIDRTPTRFIKKTRRIVKFNKDFISHGFGSFFEGALDDTSLSEFHEMLNGSISFPGDQRAAALRRACSNSITHGDSEDSYYIIAQDGKDLMKMYHELGLRYIGDPSAFTTLEQSSKMSDILLEASENSKEYLEYISENLKHDFQSGPLTQHYENIELTNIDGLNIRFVNGPDRVDQDNGSMLRAYGIPHGLTFPIGKDSQAATLGIQRDLLGRTLLVNDNNIFDLTRDQLVHMRHPAARHQRIFENKLGEFEDEQSFDTARAAFETPLMSPRDQVTREEHWVETVYEFSGDASILAGLHGSFTIGDTFDPAVLHFIPEQETSDLFEHFHANTLRPLYDEVDGYDSDGHLVGIDANDNNAMLDPALVQNSRTFFMRRSDPRPESHAPMGPYIIRPMGIDKLSNIALTAPWLIANASANSNARGTETANENYREEDCPFQRTNVEASMFHWLRRAQNESWSFQPIGGGDPMNLGAARLDSEDPRGETCKILHEVPEFFEARANRLLDLRAKKHKLLPPNIYPIPLRILVTRVYISDQSRPSEVYCKVVLPEYLEDLKESTSITTQGLSRLDAIQSNIGKLNVAIRDIMTDFTSLHNGFVQALSADDDDNPHRITSLDNKILAAAAAPGADRQREWTGRFPDFSLDFFDRTQQGMQKIYRSSALNPTSRVQFCSIERIYSKVFENDTDPSAANNPNYNSKAELDRLFSSRGNLIRRSGINPTGFYLLEKDYNLSNPRTSTGTFFQSLTAIKGVLNSFLREKRPDSLWGYLTAQTVSPLTQEQGENLSLPGNLTTNIIPTNIEDRTLKATSQEAINMMLLGNANLPDLAFTQTAPLGLTLATRSRDDIAFDVTHAHAGHHRRQAATDMFTTGFLPSWSQALLPTVALESGLPGNIKHLDAQTTPRRKLINPAVCGFNSVNSLICPLSAPAGMSMPYSIARNHNFFSFSRDDKKYRLTPDFSPGNRVETRRAMAESINTIDYYFRGENQTLIPRYATGEFKPSEIRGLEGYAADGKLIQPPRGPVSGLLNDGAGEYLVNYNRIPAIKMPFHNKNNNTLYYSDGRLSMADVSIFIRSVIKHTLNKTSRIGAANNHFGSVNLDSLYNYPAFFRNKKNAEVIRRLIQMDQAAEAEDEIEDFIIPAPEDAPIDNVYTAVYRIKAQNSKTIKQVQVDEAFDLIMQFLTGIGVMVARRYMYSIRSECNILYGETKFTNPVAPYALNLMIKVYQKIKDSNLSPEDTIAAFSAMAQYDISADLLVQNVNPEQGANQRFWNSVPANEEEDGAGLAVVRQKVPWALACLYYMHIMLCWIDTSRTFSEVMDLGDDGLGAHSDEFRKLFFMLCINMSHSTDTNFLGMPSGRQNSQMFRLRVTGIPGYNDTNSFNGDWKDRVRMKEISIMHGDGNGRVVHRLAGSDSHVEAAQMAIKPRNMEEWIPWSDLGYNARENGFFSNLLENRGGVEWLIRTTILFHNEVCNGRFGALGLNFNGNFGTGPIGILAFLNQREFAPRQFDPLDFVTPESRLHDPSNANPHNTWQAALEGYNNSFDGQVEDNLDSFAENVRAAHVSSLAIYEEEEMTSVFAGRPEDILLKMDYEMYKFVFTPGNTDYSPRTKSFNEYLLDKQITDTNLDAAMSPLQLKEQYNKAILKLLYTSPVAIPGLPANTIHSLPISAGTVINIKDTYMAALNGSTGIDQAISSAVFDKALLGVKQGLMRTSTVEQICRFVSNIPINDHIGRHDRDGRALGASEITDLSRSTILRKPSEELRTGRMDKFLSVPLGEERLDISPLGEVMINCWPLSSFKEKYHLRQRGISERLLRKPETKALLQYVLPVKRFQAISTVYATSLLSGYSTMPSILQTPKHNLAFLTKMSGLNAKERNEFLNNHSQAEAMKSLTDNPISNPENLDCFDLAIPKEFFDNFKDMLKDLIKYFPSALFRGIASTIDPAYKEMKTHWENCNIENLSWDGIRTVSADKSLMSAGLQRNAEGEKGKYSTVIVSTGRDIWYSVDSLFDGDTKPMKRTLERAVGYLYKGPVALMDGVFAFGVPCMDHESQWPDEGLKPWNADRYGHPLSPFTILALSTYQLPGEKKMRQRSGACDDGAPALYTPEHMEERVCRSPLPSPFGQMPNPEDFE
tara:strand:+ start:1244 stop:14458 length:13215 start_codon:yes stop_codon:yes gene_type:complete